MRMIWSVGLGDLERCLEDVEPDGAVDDADADADRGDPGHLQSNIARGRNLPVSQSDLIREAADESGEG